MAQEPSGLVQGAKNLYSKFEKYVGDPSKPAGQKDTTDYSWHAKKVAEANESHRKARDPKLGQKKKSGKRRAKR